MSETTAEHRATPEEAPEEHATEAHEAATGAREGLSELGDRARGIVEELARHARERRERASSASEPPLAASISAAETLPAGLPHGLGELRACVGEVADVLEATLERLETVEHQLGDPDESVERALADGIARCERVLMGIEHRVEGAAAARAERAPAGSPVPPLRRPVLVVARSSRRRADLCVAVERQGLQAVAAYDLATAIAAASRFRPCAALVAFEGTPSGDVSLLAQWTEYRERGALPPAAAMGGSEDAARQGFELVLEEHGEAAMAAVLVRLARGEDAGSRTAD